MKNLNQAKILHLIKDEKITGQVIDNFNEVDDGHIFLILQEGDLPHKIVEDRGGNMVSFDYREDPNEIIAKYGIVAIIVHALFPPQAETLLKIKKKLPTGWFVWGFDLYGHPKIQSKTYAPATNRVLLKSQKDLRIARWVRKRPFFRKLYYGKIARRQDQVSDLEAAIAKTDYFISYIREDFEVYSKYHSHKLEFLHCGFSTIDQYLAGDKSARINENAKNILIGNSNSPENNHLDVFPVLKNANLPAIKLIVPLNYGYLASYKTKVLEVGEETLGKKFHPVLEFMDRKDYVSLLQSCSAAVFYHYRQQAMGNIIALLYMGVRVYLSSKNPLFSYFGRIGVKVFDFDKEFKLYGNQKLESEIQLRNREIMEGEFSKNKIIDEIEGICKVLRKN